MDTKLVHNIKETSTPFECVQKVSVWAYSAQYEVLYTVVYTVARQLSYASLSLSVFFPTIFYYAKVFFFPATADHNNAGTAPAG